MARYQCPVCGGDDLTVEVMIVTRLYQGDDGNIQTDDEGSDHYWDETASMHCCDCRFTGEAHEFDTEDEDENAPE